MFGLVLASCRTPGDLGRYEPSYFYDELVPATRNVIADINGYTSSEFELTQDEEELRARSRTLKEYAGPAIERSMDEAVAHLGLGERNYERDRRVEHASGLAVLKAQGEVRTPDQFLSAIALELVLVDEYQPVVVRVFEADRARLQALRAIGEVPGEAVVSAHARVAENRENVGDTILTLHNRIDDYEIEARRILLEHPGSSLDEMANAIGRLAHRVHKLERRVRELTDPDGIEQGLELAG